MKEEKERKKKKEEEPKKGGEEKEEQKGWEGRGGLGCGEGEIQKWRGRG